MYRIVDRQTKQQVGRLYATLRVAHRRADQLDNQYGAYRYGVERVEIRVEPINAPEIARSPIDGRPAKVDRLATLWGE
jgi:hypothetical protein